MPFVTIPERRVQRALGRITLSLVSECCRGDARYIGLRVTIGKGVAGSLRWSGQTRVRLGWGSGDDFGWLKMEAPRDGGRKLTEQRHHYVVDFRTIPVGELIGPDRSTWRLAERPQRAAECRYKELPDGSIAVQIPDGWFEQVRPPRAAFKVV